MVRVALFAAALALLSLTDGLPSRSTPEEGCARLCSPEARAASPETVEMTETYCNMCAKQGATTLPANMPEWAAGLGTMGRNAWSATAKLPGKARAAMEQGVSWAHSVVGWASNPRDASVELLRRVVVLWKYMLDGLDVVHEYSVSLWRNGRSWTRTLSRKAYRAALSLKPHASAFAHRPPASFQSVKLSTENVQGLLASRDAQGLASKVVEGADIKLLFPTASPSLCERRGVGDPVRHKR
ncbi:hypothetical protein T484DRAFT_1849843 [Baffinella frigidus]|nr:hypothetical protein T484DRAFT_1849843 [Cryptophyta sp. CCMP2293]